MENKISTLDMEIALADYFNSGKNLVVPNVRHGVGISYEIDLLVLTTSRFAYEVEIKTSRGDLIRDKNKEYYHNFDKIKYLYFALPKCLNCNVRYIPDGAGILLVGEDSYGDLVVECSRKPVKRNDYKWSESETNDLFRLASMRVWGLKKKLQKPREQ